MTEQSRNFSSEKSVIPTKRLSQSPIFGGCLDLGISKPDKYVDIAKSLSMELDFVVLMEDRQPDFFLTYDGYNPEEFTRLNRHGPYEFRSSNYYPTQRDLRSFVKAFLDEGLQVLFGFWIHENRWITQRHPELLLTDVNGKRWQTKDFTADFNPLLEFQQDDEYFGIRKGNNFAEYICKQYGKLCTDFGFTGLFIGDGGMGFRIFGKDSLGVNFFDYSNSSIMRFVRSKYCQADSHQGTCLFVSGLKDRLGKQSNLANDIESFLDPKEAISEICAFHLDQFTRWNCEQWCLFYKQLGAYVHSETGGILGAYSCMNFGPAKARLHGVDYRQIAQAGLDLLVFQTYGFAWGKHFTLSDKDVLTNQKELLSLEADLNKMVPPANTKVLFTAEIGDSVEKWHCPQTETLEQVRIYASYNPLNFDVNSIETSCGAELQGNTPKLELSKLSKYASPDGAFLVWLNEAPIQAISEICTTFEHARKLR